MKNKILVVVIGLLALGALVAVPLVRAELSLVTASIGADDEQEINNATPGTSKTFLGTRLRGPLTQGSTTYAALANGNPNSNTGHATPTTTVFLKTTGTAAQGGETYRLGDGLVGQRLTVVLVSDGGANFIVTPATKTGFTNILMDDARDGATLKYIDNTTGWVIDGNFAATIN